MNSIVAYADLLTRSESFQQLDEQSDANHTPQPFDEVPEDIFAAELGNGFGAGISECHDVSRSHRNKVHRLPNTAPTNAGYGVQRIVLVLPPDAVGRNRENRLED